MMTAGEYREIPRLRGTAITGSEKSAMMRSVLIRRVRRRLDRWFGLGGLCRHRLGRHRRERFRGSRVRWGRGARRWSCLLQLRVIRVDVEVRDISMLVGGITVALRFAYLPVSFEQPVGIGLRSGHRSLRRGRS